MLIRAIALPQALLEQAADLEPALTSHNGTQETSEGGSWHHIAELLGHKHACIDPVQALPLLPLQVLSATDEQFLLQTSI